MAATNYNPHHKAVIDSFLLGLPGVSTGKVFGLHCYKIENSVFATFCDGGIGIKLPEARVQELVDKPDFGPFQPFGRNRGPQFVQINHHDSEMYRNDKELFLESMAYVAASSKPAKKTIQTSKTQGKIMDSEEVAFRSIAEAMTNEHSDVTWGKMMSSPGIRYKDKFFAFYYDKMVVFRFGRDFKPESLGISNYSLLAPFKTKRPLVDWFCVTAADQERWGELAKIALERMAGSYTDNKKTRQARS
jgi:hypothetical protein